MDEPTWIELYRREMPLLYGMVSRRVGGERMLAEDVTQEVWLRALRSWEASMPPDAPGAWLRTVALNVLRNYFRRRSIESATLTELGLGADDVLVEEHAVARVGGTGMAGAERAHRIQAGLARLPPEQALLLEERYFDGLSVRVLATARKTTERGIEGRLHRARGALARALGGEPDTTSIPNPTSPSHHE
ncbi:ECF RNA polymerase sigma factor SigE [Planctomycetes bacterium Poly30]|uniref:ECF RNA polymerase sigma factor SigE n=1 Tax=Saltatorellus ferox TaxID=2528018 RepID=A0A518ELV2_9BACT|nr:ECF RNA polymerase sigma factor SigE [Planctomycetes bacterium Poly30]